MATAIPFPPRCDLSVGNFLQTVGVTILKEFRSVGRLLGALGR